MLMLSLHVVLGTTYEFILDCTEFISIILLITPYLVNIIAFLLLLHTRIFIFYLVTSVDGFALPPGHTHESLGLSNEEITEEKKS